MRRIGFSKAQLAVLVGMGVSLWLGAALLLQWLAGAGYLTGSARVAVYALVVPGTLPFVLLIRRLAGLAADQLALGVAVVTATALLCDGIAVAWNPALYGQSSEAALAASAAVLWGAGVGMMLAFVFNRPTSAGS